MSGLAGQTGTVTITGLNTNFAAGTSQVSMGTGITVSNVSVLNATTLTAQVVIRCLAKVDGDAEEKRRLYNRICRLDPVQALSCPM